MLLKKMNKIEENLQNIIENDYLVIVEGKKDRAALNTFGIKRIVTLDNRPLFEVIENINEKDVVILTDLDIDGRKLFNKLRHHLQRRGIRLHNKIREELFKTKMSCVEGLAKYLS